ncbi:hypothetical protein ACFQLX_23015 [Streptomyces polyrhachis]|uniref:Regulatory protein n=1 Tax=Streptomyces polyrhachis TaxID=1282885 RepID=A0ABW2GJU6_9ACTN
MARRGRISSRQRAAGEAARRAAAAVRLAEGRPPRPRQYAAAATATLEAQAPAQVQLPAPAREVRAPEAAPAPAPAAGLSALSTCAAGCPLCAGSAEEFHALRAASLAQRERLGDAARYPYAAAKTALHRRDCREVRQAVEAVEGDDSPALRGALTGYAHEGTVDARWGTPMRLLEAGEAAQWVRENTGPRGGARYRLCRVCTPELP